MEVGGSDEGHMKKLNWGQMEKGGLTPLVPLAIYTVEFCYNVQIIYGSMYWPIGINFKCC